MADKTLIIPCFRDELGAVIVRNTGVGAPALTALPSPRGNLRVTTFAPGDWVPQDFQINHDAYIPAVGNVTLDCHAHFTFAATPAAGATVIFEYEYCLAKPTLVTTGKGSAVTYSSVATITGPTFVCDGTEGQQHFLYEIGHIDVPISDYGASLDIIGVIRLKSTSTVAAGKVALRWCDLHKLVTQFGTATEYA